LAIAAVIVIVPLGAGGLFIKKAVNDMMEQVAAVEQSSRQPSTPPSRPGDRVRPVR
jgi:hypothetical protein